MDVYYGDVFMLQLENKSQAKSIISSFIVLRPRFLIGFVFYLNWANCGEIIIRNQREENVEEIK